MPKISWFIDIGFFVALPKKINLNLNFNSRKVLCMLITQLVHFIKKKNSTNSTNGGNKSR